MKIAADPELCNLHFARAENFAGPSDGVVGRVVVIVYVVDIGANFRA